jgi:hypothetical protein
MQWKRPPVGVELVELWNWLFSWLSGQFHKMFRGTHQLSAAKPAFLRVPQFHGTPWNSIFRGEFHAFRGTD